MWNRNIKRQKKEHEGEGDDSSGSEGSSSEKSLDEFG